MDTVYALAATTTGLALILLFPELTGRARWLALVGGVAVAGSGYGNAIEHCVAEPLFILFVVGLMGHVLSMFLVGIVLLRTRQFGPWMGPLFVLAAVGLMLGFERGGSAITGAAWLGVAASFALADARRAWFHQGRKREASRLQRFHFQADPRWCHSEPAGSW